MDWKFDTLLLKEQAREIFLILSLQLADWTRKTIFLLKSISKNDIIFSQKLVQLQICGNISTTLSTRNEDINLESKWYVNSSQEAIQSNFNYKVWAFHLLEYLDRIQNVAKLPFCKPKNDGIH